MFAAFDVEATLPQVQAFAGAGAGLVSLEAVGVSPAGTVDLTRTSPLCDRTLHHHVGYVFVRTDRAEAQASAGASPRAPGERYTQIEVSVGERHPFLFTSRKLGVRNMARQEHEASKQGLRIPDPKLPFVGIWERALAAGAPREGVATIVYDHDGTRFSLDRQELSDGPEGPVCQARRVLELAFDVDGNFLSLRDGRGLRDERAAVYRKELGTLVDPRDGRSYRTAAIGRQIWMAENLAHASEGSWCYQGQERHCATYGRLYTWEAARAACPPGWHLPTDADWQWLEHHLGMHPSDLEEQGRRGEDANVGGRLTAKGAWARQGIEVTDEAGFSALSAGYRDAGGRFAGIGRWAQFWTATPGPEGPWHRNLHCDWYAALIRDDDDDAQAGYSVRCLRDRPRFP